MSKIKEAVKALTLGEATLRQVLDHWGGPQRPVIVYGLYDAIWPTIGVEGYTWLCEWCGRGDHSSGYGDLLDAALGAKDHREAQHKDDRFSLVQVYHDEEER